MCQKAASHYQAAGAHSKTHQTADISCILKLPNLTPEARFVCLFVCLFCLIPPTKNGWHAIAEQFGLSLHVSSQGAWLFCLFLHSSYCALELLPHWKLTITPMCRFFSGSVILISFVKDIVFIIRCKAELISLWLKRVTKVRFGTDVSIYWPFEYISICQWIHHHAAHRLDHANQAFK